MTGTGWWGRIALGLTLACMVSVMVGCSAPSHPTNRSDPTSVGSLPTFPDREAFAAAGGRRFWSSFESPNDFAGFYVVPSPHLGTTTQELSGAVVHSGATALHAYLHGRNPVRRGENTNHRGYPTVQFHRTAAGPYRGVVRIEFWTWLDVNLSGGAESNWFSLATLTSYADDNWYQTQLLNLNDDGFLRLQHVPSTGLSNIDIYQTKTMSFPLHQWVKITMLIDYTTDNPWRAPYVAAWQDEQLVSAARFAGRVDPTSTDRDAWPDCLDGWDKASVAEAENRCGLDYRAGTLAQAHFGLYAPPLLDKGQIYQDDLEIIEAPKR